MSCHGVYQEQFWRAEISVYVFALEASSTRTEGSAEVRGRRVQEMSRQSPRSLPKVGSIAGAAVRPQVWRGGERLPQRVDTTLGVVVAPYHIMVAPRDLERWVVAAPQVLDLHGLTIRENPALGEDGLRGAGVEKTIAFDA